MKQDALGTSHKNLGTVTLALLHVMFWGFFLLKPKNVATLTLNQYTISKAKVWELLSNCISGNLSDLTSYICLAICISCIMQPYLRLLLYIMSS